MTFGGGGGNACPVTTTITGTLSSASSTQLGRIFRDGVASVCNPPKPYPGLFNPTTTYYYNVHGPYANPGPNPSCVTVSFNVGSCATNAHAIAYQNSYDPANQGNNYLGDVGSSITQPFAFTLPAGQDLVIAVTTTAAGVPNCNYSFTISGVACQSATDVAVGKSGPASLAFAATGTYTVTASHTGLGALAASNVVVDDLLPAGLSYISATASAGTYDNTTGDWSIPSVGVGVTETLSIQVQASAGGTYTNTASYVSSTEPDIEPANNSASVVTTVQAPTSVSLTSFGGEGTGFVALGVAVLAVLLVLGVLVRRQTAK
jgi:uncharacterized repeat protein (TIGR01451 family)